MASLALILNSKPYSDGTHAVMLLCILKAPSGKVWKRRSLCRVRPEQWDDTKRRVAFANIPTKRC